MTDTEVHAVDMTILLALTHRSVDVMNFRLNKKAQLSQTNPRDACEMFARFT